MELVAIHDDVPLKSSIQKQCCQMLNHEWPRSETLRWRMLDSSRDDLPLSLALVQYFKDQTVVSVLGHVRLSRIPSDPNAVWLESVVLHPDLRGKGLGKHLMLLTEEFCKSNLKTQLAYLCTIDQQIFYARCGYQPCPPVCAYSGNVKLPTSLLSKNGCDSNEIVNKSPSLNKVPKSTSEVKTGVPAPPPPPPPPCRGPPLPPSLAHPDLGNEEEKVALECLKFYAKPIMKKMNLLVEPLRSLEVESNSESQKLNKDQICRAVIPKTFMKKML